MRRITAAILLSYQFLPPTSSFTPSQTRTTLSTSLKSTIVEKDGLFWPSSSKQTNEQTNRSTDKDVREDPLPQTLDSVLKIHGTYSDPDFLMPWQKGEERCGTSSGFVINVPGLGFRVMTNAHCVKHGSAFKVQKRGKDEKHEAVVEVVGDECDLALLRVDSLFSGEEEELYAMPLGPLPSPQDKVEVLGYPLGDEFCVTKGVVLSFDMQEYVQSGACLLAMKIDPGIDRGNSGGPVVNEELELVGVVFQGAEKYGVQMHGYVIPVSVVRHFLEDVKRNNGYTGFCQLGVSILKNQAFPKYLELEKQSVIAKINGDKSFRPRRSGVKIKSIPPTSGAHRKLKNKDVIMAVDGIPVGPDSKLLLKNGERVDIPWYISSLFEEDILQFTISRKEKGMDVSVPLTPMDVRSGVMIESIAPYSGAFGKLHSKDVIKTLDGIPVGADGKIPFRRGERVDLSCYISSLFEGDVLKVTIWRNGEEMDVSVPLKLSRMDYLVPSRLHNKPPPYLI